MVEWDTNGRHFYIREVEGEAEFHAVEELQKEVWSFSDLDIVPMATMIATQWAGGMLLCAFEGETMIGFVYGFPAHEHGHLSIHSHMLAVKPDYRNLQAGFKLKLAQREYAIEKGLSEITWTFDPLQSLNAHLNFGKLGVIARRYIVNFYGEATSSPLHQDFGTDRLWVNWPIADDRVQKRVSYYDRGVQAKNLDPHIKPHVIDSAVLLLRSEDGQPHLADLNSPLSGNQSLIEIPHQINSLKQTDPDAAIEWRKATRAAFLAALNAGFYVKDFFQINEKPTSRWLYSLIR